MHEMLITNIGRRAHFHNRHQMRVGHPVQRFHLFDGRTRKALPPATLPIDWTKGGKLLFPTDDNDVLGDCMVAAAEHADNTFTGNVGTESVFDDVATRNWYLQLSGGDKGLNEGMLVRGWKKGLPGISQANILDALDVDPTNGPLTQSAISLFGGIVFMFACPDAWINNFDTGYVWDAGPGVVANENNGHGIWWNGVLANGNYVLQTWGTHGIITPAGVALCDPSAFVVFSVRWFNVAGYAPNGKHIAELAPLWVQAGGSSNVLAAVKLFPPPTPTPPLPTPPTPAPTPLPPPVPVPSAGGVLTAQDLVDLKTAQNVLARILAEQKGP